MILAPSSKALLKAIIALAAKHSAGSEGDASGSTGKQRVLLGGYNVNNVRSMAVAAVHGNAVRHRVVVAVEVVTDEIRTRDSPFKNSRCPAQGKLYIVSFDNLAALGHADDLNVPDPFFRDEYDRPHLLESRHGSNLLGSFPRAFHVVKLDRKASEDLGVERPADGGLATDVFEMCRMALQSGRSTDHGRICRRDKTGNEYGTHHGIES
ncbi:hypothetical protein E4U09_007237 [Claviceps aff. purpurea]|uniref:Uncharacterized protein n=1 Tax=Claviceps aff. purpurea TaxID=1967640 RepID=A0A9P7QBR2_9HYPO|nr:hypothetical protein E4U09_007237 [Claviceps aff. purpurea]